MIVAHPCHSAPLSHFFLSQVNSDLKIKPKVVLFKKQFLKYSVNVLQNVIQDYITSGINNDQNIAASRGWIPVAVLAFGMFLYATELCCYLKMFRYLYLYNNSLSILPQQVTRNRNRTNAQTMIGQFYFFVADTLYALFLFVAFLPSVSLVSAVLKDLGIFMKTLDFGLMSSIHCLLIPALRKKIYLYLVITWNGLKGVVKHHQH